MQSVKSLERYVKIVNREVPARYLISKRIEVNFDEQSDIKELFAIHKNALQKFYATLKKIDSRSLKLNDLKIPKKSFLDLKVAIADKIMESCIFCERRCKINRKAGKLGFCKVGTEWKIFGAHPHFGEESELVPSATIFQAGCTLRCVYCQNAPHSIDPELGVAYKVGDVKNWIERMFDTGMRNINFVGGSPTPYTYHILKVLNLTEKNIAIIWNSNSYYSKETAELLKGVIDVYLLDFRYYNNKCGEKLSMVKNYREVAARNHIQAFGDSELLVRVLVMPGHLDCDAKPILKWLREKLGENLRLNILGQYWPAWKASNYKELNRRLKIEEYKEIMNYAKKLGFKNLV